MGDVIHHPFDPDHPLRAAEAAIGGRGLGVRLQPVAFDPDVVKVVGIVGMQHRPVRDRKRQIHRPAAARQLQEFDPCDAAPGIHTHTVVDAEVVALAGDRHVVVAVIAHLGGPPQKPRHQRAGYGQRVALAFLAAEAAAHAPAFHPHRVHRQANGLGHLVLDLCRMLGRGLDDHAPFGRQRKRGLSFQVEVLLSAHGERSRDHLLRPGDGGRRVAFRPDDRATLEPAACGKRLIDGQDRGFLAIFDPALPRGPARLKMALRDDKEDRLTDVVHRARGQKRFVMGRRRHIVGERQVIGRPDGQDPR